MYGTKGCVLKATPSNNGLNIPLNVAKVTDCNTYCEHYEKESAPLIEHTHACIVRLTERVIHYPGI